MAQVIKSEPTKAGSVLAAVLSIVLGSLLAILNLSTQAVEEVASIPAEKDRKPNVVYWPLGETKGTSKWAAYRENIIQNKSGSITLTENDLNQWSTKQFAALNLGLPASAPQGSPPPAQPAVASLRMSAPNFRIADGKLHITVKFFVPIIAEQTPILIQSSGQLVKSPKGFVFEADFIRLGRCRLPDFALIQKSVVSFVSSYYGISQEMKDLGPQWVNVVQAIIAENRLILEIP